MKKSTNQHLQPITTKINSQNHLEIGGCDLVELAKEYKTPLYVIDEETLRSVCKDYKRAFEKYENVQILYASKALCTKAITKIIDFEGFGCDVVSGGELFTVLSSGINPEKILFNGNNKSYEELEYAVKSNIGMFSVDNFLELKNLDNIAKTQNKTVKILLRITPGIECHTHEYIQTGQTDSKFGFDMTQIDEAVSLIQNEYKNLDLKGLHAHIGSQIFETEIFKDEIEILSKEFVRIKEKFGIELTEMNLGGGFGVKYTEKDTPPSIYEIGEIILNALEKNIKKYNLRRPKIYLEPGRSTICTSGVTLYTIGSSKQVPNGKKYVAVDGGMADNIRPALYGAKYAAIIANKPEKTPNEQITLVGKFCESGDVLIENINLPDPKTGDIVCVFNTGAYNYSMASNYNRMQKPAMVLVNNCHSDMIIKRESFEDLTCCDIIPKRLEN